MFRCFALLFAPALFLASAALAYSPFAFKAAEDAVSNEHYNTAIQLVDEHLHDHQQSPQKDARLLTIRAEAYAELDKLDEAEKDFNAAILVNLSDKDTRAYVMEAASRVFAGRADYYLHDQQNWKLAIENYTAALNYDPENDSIYSDRGYAYFLNLQTDEAINDFYHAIDIDDTSAENHRDLGAAHEARLEFRQAILDYSDAASRAPRDNRPYFDRGRAYALVGDYAAAERDLDRAESIDSTDAPTILWLHIVHMHANRNDLDWLKKSARSLDLKRWPGPAISYFLGWKSASDMVAIAVHSAETNKAYQKCDGWFYLAEDDLQKQDVGGARKLLQETIDNCNAVDFEWVAAKKELGQL